MRAALADMRRYATSYGDLSLTIRIVRVTVGCLCSREGVLERMLSSVS